MVSSISQPMEIILELHILKLNIETEAAKNSAPHLEQGQNPLSEFESQLTEITVTTETPCNTDLKEVIKTEPDEGKMSISVLTDECCEEMAYAHLFTYGKYAYKVERGIPLTPSKYFSQRLLNFS